MEKIWQKIEEWLAQNAPDILNDLQPAATEEQLQTVNSALGVELPDAMRQSYRIHDGTRGGSSPLFGNWRLLSLTHIISEWKINKELLDDGVFNGDAGDADPAIQDKWWSPRWVPFASNGSGDFYCVDLDPSPSGKVGQIISFWHDDGRRELLAPDFETWLSRFADDLQAGKYRVVDGRLEEVK